MAIRPVGTELFQADRWTDRDAEADSRFPQFCERAYIFWIFFVTCAHVSSNSHNKQRLFPQTA